MTNATAAAEREYAISVRHAIPGIAWRTENTLALSAVLGIEEVVEKHQISVYACY